MESTKEHGPSNFQCNIACAVAHLTWALPKGYHSREDGISLFNTASLISSRRYLILSQTQAHSMRFQPQCRQVVVSPLSSFPRLASHICCRCSRELFTLFSSLCADYARICSPSLEPGACTRSFYSLNIPAPGTYLSSTTGGRLPWLSSPRCSRRVPYTSPDTAA
jgi:hypothetical protein